MSKNTYTIGFPRIGEKRELKKALERYWAKKSSFEELREVASSLKKRHWNYQKDAGMEFISSNDFSFYDNMLDTSVMLGAIPERFLALEREELYFTMARGDATRVAMEMTKWFNTNYHYIVPELSRKDIYTLNAQKILDEYKEAKEQGIKTKINLIGPLSYLGLSKSVENEDTYTYIDKILPLYEELLGRISELDEEVYIQIDEPIFVKDLEPKVLSLIKPIYDKLAKVSSNIKIIVATYFEHSSEASKILVHTPIWGVGLDFLYGEENLESLPLIAKAGKKLIAGLVDGRNIWKNDINKSVKILNEIAQYLDKEDIYISSSSSLRAVTSSVFGKVALSTTKEWYRVA